MNHVNLFLILVIVLVVLLFVLVILLVTFREGIEKQCCGRRSSSSGDITDRRGLRNPAFDDQELPGTIQQRPFSNMEATESPPSYEDAIKQELFRFRLPSPQRSNSLGDVVSTRDIDRPSTSFTEVIDSASSNGSAVAPNPSHPSTSHQPSRSRSSTASSSCLATQLSTIQEESEDSQTVTVVIDCIGVQAARLMDKCDTSVDLADGRELASHSKC